jgi:perosamine synthetase
MIPRKRLDIAWSDFAYGAVACARIAPRVRPIGPILTRHPEALVCLSVRSGLDLLLGALEWPKGSEILITAITIPDIPRIIREHGLVPVPVDVDPGTLLPDLDELEAAATAHTRALIVTHLFGYRLPLAPFTGWARRRGLMVIEDCAQAYAGDGFTGDERSDVRMFSFGPIKTASAAGGGVLLVRQRRLRETLRRLQERWPAQRTTSHLGRLLKLAAIQPLLRVGPYRALVRMMRAFGLNHDDLITRVGRSFSGADFFGRIRRRPCAALVQLLEYRLATYDRSRLARRAAAGERLKALIGDDSLIGGRAGPGTHWLIPVRHHDPDTLMRRLWKEGFDATRGESSLCAVAATGAHRRAVCAEGVMAEVLYLPLPETMPRELVRLGKVTRQYLDHRAPAAAGVMKEPLAHAIR